MQTSVAADIGFHDAEQGQGLSGYVPLRYVATFRLDSYYPNSDDWKPLPSEHDAPMVVFELDIRSGNGVMNTLQTQPVPLAYDAVVRSRTPNPSAKCQHEQGGDWRDKQCHVVRYLAAMCMLIEEDSTGTWQLKSVVAPEVEGDANSTEPVQSNYGCDAGSGWDPAAYLVDPCFGSADLGEKCSRPNSAQVITVTVRSSKDPFIHAQVITSSSLDFGLAPATQRIYGLTMVGIGLVLCVMPLLRLREWLRRKKVQQQSREFRPEPRALGQVQPM